MSFEVDIRHSIKEIPEAIWDTMSAGKPLSSHRWHRFGEAVLKGYLPTYILLSNHGKTAARAVFWRKTSEWLPLTSRLARAGLGAYLRAKPLFACATPLTSLAGLLLSETTDRQEALDTLAGTALEEARKQQASYAIFSYIPKEGLQRQEWSNGFTPLAYSDAETCLQIVWEDFEAYLADLSQDSRRNYRRNCRSADALNLEVKVSKLPQNIDEALPLIYNVDSFHHVGHRPWTRALLEHMGMVESAWVSVRWSGRLAGCAAVVGDAGAQVFALLGLDYSVPDPMSVYYQVMYAVVRSAIESRARLLFGGGGAYELKRRLGFNKLPDDAMLVRAMNPLAALVLKWAGRAAGVEGAVAASAPGAAD